jgi:osmotically-inducible protein OsmY
MTTEPIAVDPTKVSLSSSINDLKLSTYISVNLKKADPALDDAHINVNVLNSIVLLTGEVPSAEVKLLAGKVARKFNGVRQVHNELQVRTKTSVLSRTNDSVITTQVKAKLLLNGTVETSGIKVITEDGVVYLMGKTTTENGNIMGNMVSINSGVRKVVKIFEYVDRN